MSGTGSSHVYVVSVCFLYVQDDTITPSKKKKKHKKSSGDSD